MLENYFLLCGGCSFTVMHDSWARQINKDFDNKRIVGSSAAGNDFVCRSLTYNLNKLRENNIKNSFVIVMWTEISRQDIFVNYSDDSDVFKNVLKQNVKNPDHFYDDEDLNRFDWRESAWLKSGGYDINKDKDAEFYLKPYYKYFYSEQFHFIKLLENMLFIQNLCNFLGYYVIHTFMKNLFYDNKLNNRLEKYHLSVKHLWDLVNKDTLLFPKTNKNYDGLWEYYLYNNFKSIDNGHPSKEAHKFFLDNELYPKIRKIINK